MRVQELLTVKIIAFVLETASIPVAQASLDSVYKQSSCFPNVWESMGTTILGRTQETGPVE